MRVIVTGGGTGGHIYPALAIIDKIKEKEPKSEFLYIGTHNRMEKDIVPARGIPFKSIKVFGFNRKKLHKNFKTVYYLLKNKRVCKKMIKEFNPDVVIGVGGYVTVPVLTEAHKLGYKTVIHEQNSVPGKANKMLANFTDLICISLKNSENYFPKDKTVFTGNPVSENALKLKEIKKEDIGVDKNRKLVLFVMGSLGAGTVNEQIVKSFNELAKQDYDVLFITGKKDYDDVMKNDIPANVHVLPYLDGLAGLFKNVDLMVTRAGASTISEIITTKTPSLLIPSPYVPDDHQTKNAMDLVNLHAAYLLKESELSPSTLISNINDIINDNDKIKEIKNNLAKLDITNSATKIYEEIKKIIGD